MYIRFDIDFISSKNQPLHHSGPVLDGQLAKYGQFQK